MPLYPRPIHDRNFEHLNEQIPRTTATGGWGPDLPPVSGHFRNSNLREYIDQMNSQEAARTPEMGRLEELERRLDAALQQDPDPPPVETLLDKLIGYYAEGLGDLWSAYQNAFPTGPLFETNDQPGIHEPRMTPQGEEAVMGLGMQGGISKLGKMLPGRLGDIAGYIGHNPTVREPVTNAAEVMAKKIRKPWGYHPANAAAQNLNAEYDLRQPLQEHGLSFDDLIEPLRKNRWLRDSLQNDPQSVWELGVKDATDYPARLRQWMQSHGGGPNTEAAGQFLEDVISRFSSEGRNLANDFSSFARDTGEEIANKLPTLGRGWTEPYYSAAEKMGRHGASAVQDVVGAGDRLGVIQPRGQYWAQKLKGGPRSRYKAAQPRNAPENADTWQKDILANYYADIKPSALHTYQQAKPYIDEWGPVIRALAPAIGLPMAYAAAPEPGPTPTLDEWWNQPSNDEPGAFSQYWFGAPEATPEERARWAQGKP
jgi:hypothetical protein